MKRIKSAFMTPVLLVILYTGATWADGALDGAESERLVRATTVASRQRYGSQASAINQLEMWQAASFDGTSTGS